LRKQEGKATWPTLKKAFNLIIEEIDESNPNDYAYVFSGYAPLSVRVIQTALKANAWKSKEDALRLLPGPFIEEFQSFGGMSNIFLFCSNF
jgi:hypothetical protein